MKIKILGPGCRNCHTLEERTRQALSRLHLDADLENVTDYAQIAAYGIASTPGLVIDEDVVMAGRVPTTQWLTETLQSRTARAAASSLSRRTQ